MSHSFTYSHAKFLDIRRPRRTLITSTLIISTYVWLELDGQITIKMEKFSLELPGELMTEVLARLPVKSLLRFRCVCKAWCSVISSPDFASLHLSRFDINDDKTAFLTITPPPPSRRTACYKWTLVSCQTYEKITLDEYSILENRRVMSCFDYGYFPRGSSVNGLLLLTKSVFDPVDYLVRRDLMLWNPIIGKTHKIVPHLMGCSARLGLGYSHSKNDYKVVAVTTKGNTSVHVYSLSTCTWRNIADYRESIIHGINSHGFYLTQGTIFFVSVNFAEQRCHMVSFDANDEVFSYIELPRELGLEGQWKYPVTYHDKIGLLSICPSERLCSLWVMGTDRVPGSWSKLHVVPLLVSIVPSSMLFFKKNGEFMLVNHKGEVGIYYIESGEVNQLAEGSSHLRTYCTVYKPSLALLRN